MLDNGPFGGAPAIEGTASDDEIYGTAGDDNINGLAGNDWLSGGSGNDQLYGDTGADEFIFDGNFHSDVILDFDPTEGDRLRFVTYENDYSADDVIGFATQVGDDVLIDLPDNGDDIGEQLLIKNFTVDQLNTSFIAIQDETPI